jgi:hypothetical protein
LNQHFVDFQENKSAMFLVFVVTVPPFCGLQSLLVIPFWDQSQGDIFVFSSKKEGQYIVGTIYNDNKPFLWGPHYFKAIPIWYNLQGITHLKNNDGPNLFSLRTNTFNACRKECLMM